MRAQVALAVNAQTAAVPNQNGEIPQGLRAAPNQERAVDATEGHRVQPKQL